MFHNTFQIWPRNKLRRLSRFSGKIYIKYYIAEKYIYKTFPPFNIPETGIQPLCYVILMIFRKYGKYRGKYFVKK
jgi:hypothetical protein